MLHDVNKTEGAYKREVYSHLETKMLLLDALLVGSSLLASGSSDNIDESSVVLDSLFGAPSGQLLLCLLLLHLGGLVLDLAGARKRSVHLSATAQAEHQVERRLLLDVIVRQRAAVLELLAGENQTLLVGGDALLILDLGLDIVDRVAGLNLEGDGLTREGLHEDLCATRVLKRFLLGELSTGAGYCVQYDEFHVLRMLPEPQTCT